MTDRELNIALREMARSVGLCDEWYSQWKDDDTLDECLDRYVRGHDFAVKNDWPPLAFIREHFADRKEDLHRHNIYLDENVTIEDAGNGYYVFLGNCNADVWVSGFKAVSVYCRHDTHVWVKAKDFARVFVSYYENSKGFCESDKSSKVKRYDR